MARRTATPSRRTMKIRSGDHVKVVAGKDRGKTGRVLRVEPKHERLFVEGLNMIKRHQRPRPVAGAQSEAALGGVIEREGPIHISNVMLLDPRGGAPTRVRIVREDGRRKRVAKRSGEEID